MYTYCICTLHLPSLVLACSVGSVDMRGVGEEEKGEDVDVRDMGEEVKESDDVTSPVATLPANIRT